MSKRFFPAGAAALVAALWAASACSPGPLPSAKPRQVGMSASRLGNASAAVREAVARRDFPGAVLLVTRRGRIVLRQAFGDSQWVPEVRPMSADMIFDLASITKPVATATSIMVLVERGRLSLNEKVRDFVPDWAPFLDEKGREREPARLWHLLTHTSGLPAYTNADAAARELGAPCSTEALVGRIAGLRKNNPPGAAFDYSCLGYITLARIVQIVTGRTIDVFAEENVFAPLGMAHTFYRPRPRYWDLCVPTQVYGGQPLRGLVHDPLARLQGGISGNAGLFSTADDLAVFAQMILDRGVFRGRRILGPLAVERLTSIFPKAEFAGRGLGWDLASAYASNRGDLFGARSFGHSGYTGTSIWIDPETRTTVILLTNSVHPEDKGKGILALRARVADAVAAAILEP